MFRFHHEFRITDPAAWSDLSFKQTTALLEALTSEREAAAGFEAPAPNPVVPNTTVGVTNVPSSSRPKNGSVPLQRLHHNLQVLYVFLCGLICPFLL
jgi:hypothetical protein